MNIVEKPTYLNVFLVFSALLLLKADYLYSGCIISLLLGTINVCAHTDIFKVLVLRDSINGSTEIQRATLPRGVTSLAKFSFL